MDAKRLLARYRSEEPQWHEPVVKTAAFPSFPPKEGSDDGGPLPPKNDLGGGKKRNIPKNHPFDPKALKPLAKALWASSVAMGHALTAYRHLSRLKSATISPDGMLGGRGYVMDVAEIRKRLNDACESLSAITDTLHDEIGAPHWKPRMSELDENETEDIQNYLGKSEEILENPEEDAENEIEAIEKQNDLDDMDEVDEEGNPDDVAEEGEELEAPEGEEEELEAPEGEALPTEESEEDEDEWAPASAPVDEEGVDDDSEEEEFETDEDAEEEDSEDSDDALEEESEDEDGESDPDLALDEDDLAAAEKAAESTDALWGTQEEAPDEGSEEEEDSEESEEVSPEESEEAPEDEEPPKKKKKLKKKAEPPMASDLPTGGNASADLSEKTTTPHQVREARTRRANSSLPVETLPGGPRVEHLDREDGPPENGPIVLDDWGLPSEREYLYPTPWGNDTREAQSGVPDANTDDTPTEAWDFGLGYGASGQGAGGYANPSNEGNNKGVWGPSSGLPGAPSSSSGDTTPKVELELNERKSAIATYEQVEHYARDFLPGDLEIPVARSDYYRGDRGNLVNTQSGLPGEPAPGGAMAPSLMNTDTVHEDLSTPYVRYDYTTPDYRDDPLHEWPQSHQAGMNNDG